MGVTAWAKTGPSGPKYQVNFGDQVSSKMHRHHANIQEEVAVIVQTIRKEMKSDLVPLAEEKANYGKIVKTAVRELWSLEYEIEEIQTEFAKGIGSIDIANLTDF